jgi:hypothetical protein
MGCLSIGSHSTVSYSPNIYCLIAALYPAYIHAHYATHIDRSIVAIVYITSPQCGLYPYLQYTHSFLRLHWLRALLSRREFNTIQGKVPPIISTLQEVQQQPTEALPNGRIAIIPTYIKTTSLSIAILGVIRGLRKVPCSSVS